MKTVGEFEGGPVTEAVLRTERGSEITIISYGATIRDWRVHVGGEKRRVVLGYDTFEPYKKDESYLGAIIGRVANRIGGARFELNGKTYAVQTDGKPFQLHGGPKGLGRRNWKMRTADGAVVLKFHSPALEMGFPGEADFTVTYSVTGEKLKILMQAQVSEPTPISMAQHGYFNLAGWGSVLDHRLRVDATAFTPLDSNLVPTGEIRGVKDSIYDFNTERTLRGPANEALDYDINLVLNPARDPNEPAAWLAAPGGSVRLRLWTDRPGVQVYNAIHLGHSAVCLEDQMFPDAVNRPEFPPVVVTPEKPYRHECAIEIAAPAK
jgi:aldose 1-epimerase